MRFLPHSAIKNASIQHALVDPLANRSSTQRPCIPTAMYGQPQRRSRGGGYGAVHQRDKQPQNPDVRAGWKSWELLELALPSIDEEHWVPKVRETDVLLVSGGDVPYPAPPDAKLLAGFSCWPRCARLFG